MAASSAVSSRALRPALSHAPLTLDDPRSQTCCLPAVPAPLDGRRSTCGARADGTGHGDEVCVPAEEHSDRQRVGVHLGSVAPQVADIAQAADLPPQSARRNDSV
jgi:hypothetical protein